MNKGNERNSGGYTNGALAEKVSVGYDMSAFDVAHRSDKRTEVTSIVDRRRKAELRRGFLKGVVISASVIAMLVGIVSSYTELTELTSESSKLKNQNEQLLNDQKRMQAELDMRTNLKDIEEIATSELYMHKVEQDQIIYVDLTSEDTGNVIEDERGFIGKATDTAENLLIRLGEYMS